VAFQPDGDPQQLYQEIQDRLRDESPLAHEDFSKLFRLLRDDRDAIAEVIPRWEDWSGSYDQTIYSKIRTEAAKLLRLRDNGKLLKELDRSVRQESPPEERREACRVALTVLGDEAPETEALLHDPDARIREAMLYAWKDNPPAGRKRTLALRFLADAALPVAEAALAALLVEKTQRIRVADPPGDAEALALALAKLDGSAQRWKAAAFAAIGCSAWRELAQILSEPEAQPAWILEHLTATDLALVMDFASPAANGRLRDALVDAYQQPANKRLEKHLFPMVKLFFPHPDAVRAAARRLHGWLGYAKEFHQCLEQYPQTAAAILDGVFAFRSRRELFDQQEQHVLSLYDANPEAFLAAIRTGDPEVTALRLPILRSILGRDPRL
jgi:hypothetical protein